MAAIDLYLERTSTEGRGAVASAMRLLEVRIGVLLGPAKRDHDRRPGAMSTATDIGLTKDERTDFRKMAANPEKVREVIEGSSDEKPASRSFGVASDSVIRRAALQK